MCSRGMATCHLASCSATQPENTTHNSNARLAGFVPQDEINRMEDAFSAQMMVPNMPIRVDRATMRRLKTSEVIVRPWPNPHIPAQYFRVMDTELPLCSGPCGHFFEQDEYEMVRGVACVRACGTSWACRNMD